MRPDEIASGAPGLDAAAQSVLKHQLDIYRADAAALPLDAVAQAWQDSPDPLVIAAWLNQPLERVMRRLATLPAGIGPPRAGLVVCDASGAILRRRPLDGLTLPRGGAACPLWPLYQVLAQPQTPLRMRVRQAGRGAAVVEALAVAAQAAPAGFDRPALAQAHMLLLPDPGENGGSIRELGVSCRICPLADCVARREPSIIAEGF